MDFAKHFAAEHAMLPDMTLSDMDEGLAQCHALGVVLQVRRLLLEGVEASKKELLPQSVLSFVTGLGEQQLPDGRRAGQFLQPVLSLTLAPALALALAPALTLTPTLTLTRSASGSKP